MDNFKNASGIPAIRLKDSCLTDYSTSTAQVRKNKGHEI